MKKTKTLLTFLFAVLFISLQSCDNEPLDADVVSNDNTNQPEENSTGDYWPRAIGNIWNFNDTYYGDVSYHVVSTEEIDGNTYYKFDDLLGQESWLRKSGDSYYIRTLITGFDIQGYEVSTTSTIIKMLEDSALVGDEWNSNLNYTITYTPSTADFPSIPDIVVSADYNFEMMERDAVRTVEGVEYTDVLHVKLSLASAGVTLSTYDYFYAKDIGLIEFSGSQSSGTLMNYNLN